MACLVWEWKIPRSPPWDATRLRPAPTNGCSGPAAPGSFGQSPEFGRKCARSFRVSFRRTFLKLGKRNTTRDLQRERHGFRQEVFKLTNIISRCLQPFVFTRTSGPRESRRAYTN